MIRGADSSAPLSASQLNSFQNSAASAGTLGHASSSRIPFGYAGRTTRGEQRSHASHGWLSDRSRDSHSSVLPDDDDSDDDGEVVCRTLRCVLTRIFLCIALARLCGLPGSERQSGCEVRSGLFPKFRFFGLCRGEGRAVKYFCNACFIAKSKASPSMVKGKTICSPTMKSDFCMCGIFCCLTGRARNDLVASSAANWS